MSGYECPWCGPAGHTYFHRGSAAVEVLAPWIAAHEMHEETKA